MKKSKSSSSFELSRRKSSSSIASQLSSNVDSQSSSKSDGCEIKHDDGLNCSWYELPKTRDALRHKHLQKQLSVSGYVTSVSPAKHSFQNLQRVSSEQFQRRILNEPGKVRGFDNPNERAALRALSRNYWRNNGLWLLFWKFTKFPKKTFNILNKVSGIGPVATFKLSHISNVFLGIFIIFLCFFSKGTIWNDFQNCQLLVFSTLTEIANQYQMLKGHLNNAARNASKASKVVRTQSNISDGVFLFF